MDNFDCIIYGLGYIGLPTAVYLASRNIKVYGLDIDKKIVENIYPEFLIFYKKILY